LLQIGVSLLGILIMIAVAWVLDRANQVPDLFVDVVDVEQKSGTAVEGAKA